MEVSLTLEFQDQRLIVVFFSKVTLNHSSFLEDVQIPQLRLLQRNSIKLSLMPTVIEWGVTGRTFAVIIVGKRQFPNPCRSIQFYQNKKLKLY